MPPDECLSRRCWAGFHEEHPVGGCVGCGCACHRSTSTPDADVAHRVTVEIVCVGDGGLELALGAAEKVAGLVKPDGGPITSVSTRREVLPR